MHEMAITRSMLDIVLEEAAKSGSGRVTMINVVLGEMSGVVDTCVQFYFDFMSKDTPAEGAELNFRKMPKQAKCRKCGSVFSPTDIFWSCDKCGSMEIEVTAGNELYVESIEVE
ncbi:MAG TPA: hydrogenase maturation nickel metallochaperone HypA [Dehalococcoidia bacterium]|nr:hydrogenase maturation nickel metallochaperone HypA [Dehalococcoidia bacterium]